MNQIVEEFDSLGIFADWAIPTKSDVDFAIEHGFNEIIIGISPNYKLDKIASKLEDISRYIGNSVYSYAHFMVWAKRRESWIRGYFRDVLDLCLPLFNICVLDTEEDYYKGTLHPIAAASTIADEFFDLDEDLSDRELAVTSIGKIPDSVIPLIPFVDTVIPFAYSFWKNTKQKHWSHSQSTFPGPQQVNAYNSWTKQAKDKKFIMGLSCYDGARPAVKGVHPKLTATQTMMLAFGQTLNLEVTNAWIWSLKHLQKKTATEERRFFL